MKCLIIDDNKDITDAISFYFESENIPCKVVNDGKEGLEVIKNEDHDLILLDLAMPNCSGHDIINALHKENLMSEKKIILVTASSMNDEKLEELKKKGVLEIIKKPVSMDTLKETIIKYGKNSS